MRKKRRKTDREMVRELKLKNWFELKKYMMQKKLLTYTICWNLEINYAGNSGMDIICHFDENSSFVYSIDRKKNE